MGRPWKPRESLKTSRRHMSAQGSDHAPAPMLFCEEARARGAGGPDSSASLPIGCQLWGLIHNLPEVRSAGSRLRLERSSAFPSPTLAAESMFKVSATSMGSRRDLEQRLRGQSRSREGGRSFKSEP